MSRTEYLLNDGWRFHKADLPVDHWGKSWKAASYRTDPGIGRAFDDSSWRVVNVPHDYSLEGPFDIKNGQSSRGYLPSGVAWYRRQFSVDASLKGSRILLCLDGVFRDSTVYLNEFLLGSHPSGYVPARFDISAQLDYDRPNVISVRVDANLPEGWWYEGAGIYRDVRLLVTGTTHLPENGISVRCDYDPAQPELGARVSVLAEIANHGAESGDVIARVELLSPAGKEIASASSEHHLEAMTDATASASFAIADPQLWSLTSPTLYRVRVTLRTAAGEADTVDVPFGVRSAVFDANLGLVLNGVPVKIKGACNHQDHGGTGTAIPAALHEFRTARLKEFGFNAIRTSHNLPTPVLLDICDRVGVLVFAETRHCDASPAALEELRELVRLGRNHPSVVLWGLGNEEEHLQAMTQARPILLTMRAVVRALDPTRPVTMGMNTHHEVPLGPASALDVIGFNYTWDKWDAVRALYPDRCCVETEQANTYTTRGVYTDRSAEGYLVGYDRGNFWIGITFTEPEVTRLMERPWMAGGFIWTGFDYRGEPLPFAEVSWKQCNRTDPIPPVMSCHFGAFDLCGFPKDIAWYFKAWYGSDPVLHLFPHWNWSGREGQPIDVWCYSNAHEVELLVNGVSAGRRAVPRFGHCEWSVAYAPGHIEAIGYQDGREVLRTARETTGPAINLRLAANRTELHADLEDCVVVAVDSLDSLGRHVPVEERLVQFSIEGPARIIGVSNGDPVSVEPDRARQRRLFAGLAMVLVQSLDREGTAVLSARAEGLAEASLKLMVSGGARRATLASPVTAPDVPETAPVPDAYGSAGESTRGHSDVFGFYDKNATSNRDKA